jgi:ATP-dependent RNA helicase RhlE
MLCPLVTRFQDLNLIGPLLRALEEEGYSEPTPIQAKAIPHVLTGKDLLGCAQTGTGKTAGFALPILQRLVSTPLPGPQRPVRSLVLAPTRELAAQIGDSFVRYGRHSPLRIAVIFGGVGQEPQVRAIRQGVDILVATPGRLLDLLGQNRVRLDRVEVFVLDEADRMLDMGFIHDVRRVVAALPRNRQTLFFSATMPPDIQALARDILNQPVRVEVAPASSTVEKIEQSLCRLDKGQKPQALVQLLRDPAFRRTIIFTRTKRGANRVAETLEKAGIKADAIHGNKGQSARERALENFRTGASRALVATDIASRGIDVDGITHVVNYDLPDVPENYVHRIGRTARAGATGTAISFCGPDEIEELSAIEKLIRMRIPSRVLSGFAAPPSQQPHPRPPAGPRPPLPHGRPPFRHRFRR